MAGAAEDEKQVIQQGTNVTLFECRDKQEELFGWLFMKYLTNYESALDWTLRTAYFPIRKDVAASEAYQEYVSQITKDEEGNEQYNYDAVKQVCIVGLEQAPYFYTSVAFPGSAKARTEGELIIQEILYNQKEYTIDKAIADALAALKHD
jgi:ABC-type glycerol-3-phosphate transport system substrate-binding protein